MNNVLKSMRLNIGIFGKRNVGKSSLINFLTNQNISIVSDTLGTTTDAVEKIMELLPIGPVNFIDTAGIDDIGELGNKRVNKTFDVINRIDVALIVCDFNGINEFEINLEELINEPLKTPSFKVRKCLTKTTPNISLTSQCKPPLMSSLKTKGRLMNYSEKFAKRFSMLSMKSGNSVSENDINAFNLDGNEFEPKVKKID